MAFWHRLNQSKLKLLSHQLKRSYAQPLYPSLLNYTTKTSNSCRLENPFLDVSKRPTCKMPNDSCNNVRFFATSFQAKTKDNGPRLNDQITSQFIRLVTDEGHGVVPRREALERAKKLKLDLVEVDRNVDPPVCKIMDFNKEKYKQQSKEKDRVKSKSEVTLRKGDCKEVRFSAKTEQKDLKIKADSVIRLMERGYRVKCMALGSPKKGGRASKKHDGDLTEEEIAERIKQEEEEKEELRATLSRLTALMGDEFIIESGPRVEKKQAYVLVRHAKFGQSKKVGAKKFKDVQEVANAKSSANHSGPVANSLMAEKDSSESAVETEDKILSDEDDVPDEICEDNKTTWSIADSTDGFDGAFAHGTDDKDPSIYCREDMNIPRKANSSGLNFSIPNVFQPKPAQDSQQLPSSPQPSLGTINRYKPQPSLGTEKKYKPPPSLGTENRYKVRQQFPLNTSRDSRGPDKPASFGFEPRLSPRSGHSQSEINVTSSIGESKPVRTDSSAFRNMKLPPEMLKQLDVPSGTSSPASSFGMFSSPKASSPGKQDVTAEVNNSEGNRYNSGRDSTRGLGVNPKL
ncbi:translation initiation factor IF3-1, mitochondrial [Ricinus communis]|uniref:Translation initiation factor if-3, putative n=1 Tax=Ricinus communis TaxID=3988 RepID=B9RJ84_RICCO|nr:translation initiation factor IF3-1, mitochondrial [Ricinus communis]XP_015571577.1 translation initiation factor IF3-1, mitochondrial [Ricinus communis]XP_025012192.1 translation initiation factor IF3-1, mitochondrial [Ricinus communis]EEF48386.1 translation initiation factor if-3, putative [Ricinus communis]|eukprot:XP_002513803.1 translation initiation factor IF3-1, mitochondrial [Ricinus communis]